MGGDIAPLLLKENLFSCAIADGVRVRVGAHAHVHLRGPLVRHLSSAQVPIDDRTSENGHRRHLDHLFAHRQADEDAFYARRLIGAFVSTTDIPELVVLETSPREQISITTIYFTQCQPNWGDDTELYSQLVKFALLYALPLLFISVTYYQIVRVLWRSARLAVVNPASRTAPASGASAASAGAGELGYHGSVTGDPFVRDVLYDLAIEKSRT